MKVALVTGGALGIGRACCEALLAKAIKVCLLDINTEAGEQTTEELRKKYGQDSVTFIKCDVASRTEFEDAFKTCKKTFGRLDIVCNNAAILKELDVERCMQVNLIAIILGTQLALKYMGKDKGGQGGLVVNVASACGLMPCPNLPVYSATKAGVVNFSRSIANDPDSTLHGVRVNVICPSVTDTTIYDLDPENFSAQSYTATKDAKAVWSKEGWLRQPSDVAESIMKFVNDETLNGEVILDSYLGAHQVSLPDSMDALAKLFKA